MSKCRQLIYSLLITFLTGLSQGCKFNIMQLSLTTPSWGRWHRYCLFELVEVQGELKDGIGKQDESVLTETVSDIWERLGCYLRGK